MTGAHRGERDKRQREFRRMVGWSAVAHLCLLGLAVVSPRSSSNFDATQVIAVDLVALPAPARMASQPPPKATKEPSPPAEKPPPPPPKPKQVVLPKNAERDPAKPKVEPKPAPKQEVAPEPTPEPEKNLEDLLAEFRDEAGEQKPSETPPPETTAAAPSGVPNAGVGVRVSPEVLAWMRKAKIHVRRAWVVPPGFRAEALETHVVVELDASGAVVGQPRIVRRSGNPWFDEGVVRGIEKSSPLPPPPRAGEWDFVFLPEDAY